ncbi:ABC transporter substrate-binding protein [Roseovarius arcticus]|uniref:ABC transporter substrate-binding protein n=1 Tax=Roseovarius arcticus TaxID=2547404 RepID=UPI0011105964|nr:ABC transporter substrate-binding protein [Roseovarius arcticus]
MSKHFKSEILNGNGRSLSGPSRRGVLAGLAGTGLAVSATGLLTAGQAQAATPKKGGHYRVGIHEGNTNDSLDPRTTNGVCMIQLNHTIFNFLVEIDTDDSIIPELAESWEASGDAKSWLFKIRSGVEFHNGKPLTASDVVASIMYHLRDDSESAAKPLLEGVTSITAEDEHSVRFELSEGNADLPYVLTDYHFVILPADGEGNVDISGVGTGGYMLDSFEPGVRIEMTRNPNYFKDGRAHFDEVTFLIINDSNARTNALLTGEVDSDSQVAANTLQFIERNDRVTIDNVPSAAHVTIPMHVDTAPFDNVDVRLALKHAIDRQEAIDKVMGGAAVVGNDHPIGPTMPYYSELEQNTFDLDKSKFHLKKAGMEDLSVTLAASDAAFPGAVDMATLFQASAKKAGINMKVDRKPADNYWSDVWLKNPFCTASWGARPTPQIMFSLGYKGGAAWNESHWDNAQFNSLLEKTKAELDDAKRTEMYAEMMRLCRDDGGTVVPFFYNRLSARGKNVAHSDKISGNWQLDGARSAERWWFE